MSLYLREFRLIFEGTREGVLAITSRSIRDANPAFCDLLDYTHSQLMRQAPLDLLTPESKAVLEHHTHERSAGSAPLHPFALVLVTRRGTRIPVSVRLVKADSCWLLFVQARVIAGDEVTESSLPYPPPPQPEDRDRYRQLVEHLADGLVTLNDVGSLLFVNKAFASLLGYSTRSPLVSRPLLELVAEEDRARVARGLELWGQGEQSRFEANLQHADGRPIPTLLSGRSLPPSTEGVPAGMLILVTDFAERRELLEKLALARQMEALSSLAGGIAHDFNNLLTGILGNASAIRAVTAHNSDVSDLARGVEESAELAARLTQRLLALVRGQAPHRRLLDVGALVQETLNLLTRVIPDEIEVRTDIDQTVPPALADESQLQQAVLNLCINARDAMLAHSGGGVLELSVRPGLLSKPLDDGGSAEEPAVILQVTDTGPGVPNSLRRRIFDPFFTTKGLGRGMGLGLSSVYNLVHAHGGTVEVEHAPRGGAQFSIKLPAHPGKVAAVRRNRTPEHPLPLLRGTGTILVAEDEPAIRHMVSSTLMQQGYTVLSAADGQEAIDLFEEHASDIDLMVLDVRMPYVDGTDVLRHARSIRPDMPAVLSSGFVPEEHESSHDLPEQILFLPKPYRMPELLLAISRAMAGPPSGEFDKITPALGIDALGRADDTDHGGLAPAGKGFDPARTLTEGEMPTVLNELAALLES